MTLITDPAFTTRIGPSVKIDTTPDLTFLKNVTVAEWTNTHESMGSDRYIVSTNLKPGPSKPRGNTIRITKWDAFREFRQAEIGTGDDVTEIANIDK